MKAESLKSKAAGLIRLLTSAATILSAEGAHVKFVHESSDTSVQASRHLILYTLAAPYTNGAGSIVTRDWLSRTLDTNGQVTISNLYSGPYMEVLQGTTRSTTNFYVFPDTNGLIMAADWVTNSGVAVTFGSAYSQAQADGRFYPLLTNPSNYVNYDGGGLTNLSYLGSNVYSAGVSYPSIISTNIVSGDDTNNLYVSGATTYTVANGHYTFKTGSNPAEYTNAAGVHFLNKDDLANDGYVGMITNAAAGELYGTADAFPLGPSWAVFPSQGQETLTVIYGTNSTPYVQFAGVTISSNSVLYVDPTNGSDYVWFRGDQKAPLRTLAKAVSVSSNYDTIQLSAGVFDGGITPRMGTKLIGAGRTNSYIGNDGSGSIYCYSNNISLANFSSGVIYVGNHLQGITNLTLVNVDGIGQQDGLFVRAKYQNLLGINSTFGSRWDAWADYSAQGQGWDASYLDSTADFYSCNWINDAGWAGTVGHEAIVLGPGKVRFFGGYIRARQSSAGHVECVFSDPTALGTNGYAEFWNVSMDCANTNGSGTAWAIHNDIGTRIVINGGSMNPLSIYDPSNRVSVVGGYAGNLLVKSNALSTIPVLRPGDTYYWSSNGVAYVICSSPSGVLTTNKLGP